MFRVACCVVGAGEIVEGVGDGFGGGIFGQEQEAVGGVDDAPVGGQESLHDEFDIAGGQIRVGGDVDERPGGWVGRDSSPLGN